MATGYFLRGTTPPSGARKIGSGYLGNPAHGGSWADLYEWESDKDKLDNGISDSRAQAAAAVGSSQSGVQAILGQSGIVNGAIGRMNDAADAMLPIAADLNGYGNSMWESGTKVTEQALETLGTGLGFIRMDESASPLVAEAIRLYGEFDPDRYVAGAAQDMQSQFDNSQKQAQRQLSRMGVSPTSGAALALNNLRDRALAVARASAMTRARERGKTEQMGAFQSLIANNANTFLKTGGELASIGSSAQAQAANAKKGAASVLGDAGNLAGQAGNLGLNFGNALSSAYNKLAGVQLSQAGNTLSGENLRLNARRGGGTINTSTGRHYGVGGELLETGNPAVDAQLQMARDAIPTTYEKNLGLA